MKKKSLLLLMLLATFATISNAQLVWQRVEHAPGLAAGTTTSLMPFNNSKAYSYTQSIYDKDYFSLTNGAYIDTIWFYCVSPAATPAVDANVNIYLAETDLSVASSLKGWIAGTEVFSSTSTVQPTEEGWFYIKLATPFNYSGTQNLVVIIDRQGSEGSGQTYSGVSGLTARTSLGYSNAAAWAITKNGTTGTGHQADIRLSVRAPKTNQPVDDLTVSSVAATTASIGWDVNGNALTPTGFEVKYGLRDGAMTRVIAAADALSQTLSGLTPGMYYTATVRAICGAGDTSSARSLTFLTDCAPKALPWAFVQVSGQTQSYSSYKLDNELPVCFDFPGLATTTGAYPQAYQRAIGDDFGVMVGFIPDHPAIVVLPEFDGDLSTAMLTFTLRGTSGVVEYGYITNPADSTTFNALGTAAGSNTTVADFEELQASIPGSARLAIRATANTTGTFSEHIYNIIVEPAPACKRPSGLAVDASSVTTNSFKVTWGGSKEVGDEYHVVIKNLSGSTVLQSHTTSNQELLITGLTLGTNYNIYVSKHCAAGGVETDSARIIYGTHGEVAVSLNNDSYGTVNGATTGKMGTHFNLTATPNPHYSFTKWVYNGATEYTDNPLTTPTFGTELRPLVAHFTPDVHTVSVSSNNDSYGTVGTSATSADYGTSVTLTATPVGTATFVGWSDGLEGTNLTRPLTVSGDMNVQGVFVPAGSRVAQVVLSNPDHATYTAKVGGVNVPADGIVADGSSVVITVTVDPNYSVTGWTGLRGGNTPTYNEGTRTYTVTHVADANAVIGVAVGPLSYSLALGANADGLGILQGAGTYEYGSTAYATAVPAAHCRFVKWTDDNTTNPRQLTISGNTELTAVFEKDSFTVGTAINIPGAATIDISDGNGITTPKYAYGDMVWISATPSTHYIFNRWAKGTVSAATQSHHFLVFEDQTWSLIMNVEQKTITGQVQSPADGTVTPASVSADWNSQVTLTANNGEHYTFSQWTDGNTTNPRTVTVTDNATYTAQYTPNQYTITVADDGHGTAYASGDASHSYAYATTATLTASPQPGYHFLYWKDAEDNIVSTQASYSPVVEGDATYTAHFEQTEYTIIITSMNGGAIEGGNITILNAHYGDPISATLTIANPLRYTHTGWSGITGHDSENPLTFTVTDNMTIEAIIGDAEKITVSVSSANPAMGNVSGGGQYFANDDVVTLTATPNEHYHFVDWTPGNITSNPYMTTVSAPLTLTANFEIDNHMVSVTSNDYTMGSAYGAGQYAYGSTQAITAVPAAGHSLVNWTITRTGESPKDTTGTGLVLNLPVTANTTVEANFAINQYTLTLNGDNVVLTGDGDYNYGTQVEIGATPNANYDFDGWSDGNANATRTVTVNDNMTLTALTSQHDYELTAMTDDATMGTASVNYSTRHYGQLGTFTALPNQHYSFVRWNDGNTENPRDVVVSSDTALTAYFEAVHYGTVIVDADVNYGTLATPSDTAAAVYGSELQFVATPNVGVEFVQWSVSVDGAAPTVYTANPLNLVLRGNITVSATFDSIDYTVTIASNDVEMGTVEPGGTATYKYGASINPVATVRTGMEDAYKFVSWGDGETNPAHSTITVDKDMTLTAIFGDKDKYTVAVVSNNDDWGTATVDSATSASKLNNETVTLEATANSAEHYRFVKWNDGNTDNPRTVTVHDNAVYTAFFALEQYDLTIADVENGTVTGATTGTYDYGTEFRLYAQAATNYHFTKWSDENVDNPRDIAVTGDATYTAVFDINTFDIAATYSNATVTGEGTYDYGALVTLTATADENYHFVRWTKNGIEVSTSNTINFTAIENATYVAEVAKDQYTLTVTSANTAFGSVAGSASGSYDFDENVKVWASPAAHYHFVNWNDNPAMDEDTIIETMSADLDLTAYFAIDFYPVTVSADANGTVNDEINGNHNYGELVTLIATPTTPGYVFDHWSDNFSTDNPRTDAVAGEINATAVFVQEEYSLTLTVNDDDMGETIITAGEHLNGKYYWHENVTVKAHVKNTNLYKFLSWSDGLTDSVRDITFEGDVEYKAIFGRLDMLTVSVLSNNSNWGAVEASATSVNLNDDVTITANAAEHYHLVGWSDIDGYNTTAERDIHVTSDTIITAIFAIDTHNVVVNAGEHSASVSGAGQYAYGSKSTLYAEAEEHYQFLNWTDMGSYVISSSNPYIFNVEDDITINANFELKTYTLTLVAGNGGTVEGAGDYTALDYATITATAAHNYTFGAWMKDGDTVSTDESINVYMDGNHTYTAVFVEDPLFTIALQSENLNMGTVNNVSNTHVGDEVNIKATPKPHYHFVAWVDAADETSIFGTEADTTFIASENLNLVAKFRIDTVLLTLVNDGNGELFGEGYYDYGTDVTITNEPAEHYHLYKWYNNVSDSLASTPTYTVHLTGDTTIGATFVMNTYTLTFSAENGSTEFDQQQYTALDSVIVAATAQDTNYTFFGWVKNGVAMADQSDTLRTIAEGNDNYVAVFTENGLWNVRVYSNNIEMGSVAGDDTYHDMNLATVNATPAEHYHLLYWKNQNGDIVSTDSVYNFNISENTILTAYFAIDTHHVVMTNNHNDNVSEGDFAYGTNVTFTAGGFEGYHFKRFENVHGDIMSLENPMDVEIVQDTNVVIIYAIDTVNVTLVAENGEIETDTLRYLWGSGANFTAVAADRYHFVSWSNGELDTTVTVNLYSDTTVSAIFEKDLVHLTIIDDMADYASEYDFPWGVNLQLSHADYEHYHFMGFYDENDSLIGMDNPTVYYFDTAITIHATFAIDTHDVTLVAENGTIFYDTLRYIYGATAEFTYEPAENYHFDGWMVNGVAAGNADVLSFTVEGNATVEALFSIDSYTFSVVSNDMAKGYVTGTQNGTYNNGDAIEVVAHANQYNVFVGWMSGDDTLSTADTLLFNIVSDTTIVAVFASELFNISAVANDTNMGSVEGTGMFTFHSLTTLVAVPAEGHHFLMWSDSLTTPSRLIYVENDVELTAYFEIDSHYVTVLANDTLMGTVSGEGWYNWGDTVTVRAYVNDHFNFIGFNGRTDHVDSVSFVVTKDTTLTAYFDYQYLAIYSNHEHGNVNIEVAGIQANTSLMPVIAHYGDSIVMTATPDTHYHFVNWVEYSLSYDTTSTIDTTYITETSTEVDPNTGETVVVIDTIDMVIDTVEVVNTVYTADTTYDTPEIGYRIYSNRYIDAVFEVNQVTLQLLGMHATVEGAATYNAGDSVTVSATVAEHYVFVGWSDGVTTDTLGGGQYNIIDTNLTFTFVIEEDMTLWAIAEGEAVSVTLIVPDELRGSVEGAGTYHYGDVVTISATSNDGYYFESWTREDGVAITEAEYSFTIVADVTLTANFHKIGIQGVDQADVKVYANGDVIYVNGAESQTVRVYDAVGRMVSSTVAGSESIQLHMQTSGVYMVQVGNSRAQRVMIVR